jgi:predicted alpha/beta superfamily hydrolase
MNNTNKLIIFIIIVYSALIGCNRSMEKNMAEKEKVSIDKPVKYFSKSVNDTFTLFTSFPVDYDPMDKIQYPIVYLLDANLYFDMLAPILKKYTEVGMLPPVILTGIGYDGLLEMDSLRCRDYTYPLAIPEY